MCVLACPYSQLASLASSLTFRDGLCHLFECPVSFLGFIINTLLWENDDENETGDFVSLTVIQQESCVFCSVPNMQIAWNHGLCFSIDTHTFSMVHCCTAHRMYHGSICLTKWCACVGALWGRDETYPGAQPASRAETKEMVLGWTFRLWQQKWYDCFF